MNCDLASRRMRAPTRHGEAVIEPALCQVAELLESNRLLRAAYQYNLGGRSLAELASQAQTEIVHQAVQYTRSYSGVADVADYLEKPIVLAGHQPELFHAGVWFKNFVLDAIARRQDAVAINLIIDSDTIKSAALRVPTGTLENPSIGSVPFDQPSEELPHEQRAIRDRALFTSFADRVGAIIAPLIADPLVHRLWSLAVERMEATGNLGLTFAQSRHQLEQAWGLSTLELPQSQVCELPAFHWFVAHLLAELPRFWQVHNDALMEYRHAHRLRSKTHPVPDLARGETWFEAPLWVWSDANPLRRRVFACRQRGKLVLGDCGGWQAAFDFSPGEPLESLVEQLAGLSAQGIKLRTRALVTTMFARLFVGELFLHGIGGAKYDQLTDEIIRKFFGCEPPAFMAVTATLHLPFGARPTAAEPEPRAATVLREMRFHPERFLDGAIDADSRAHALVDEKRRWIATPKTPENAHLRHLHIAQANAALQPFLAERRQAVVAQRALVAHRQRASATLNSREYSFCLFPEDFLRHALFSAL